MINNITSNVLRDTKNAINNFVLCNLEGGIILGILNYKTVSMMSLYTIDYCHNINTLYKDEIHNHNYVCPLF